MLFAAFVFSPMYCLIGVAVVLAIVAGIGLGHASANRYRDSIREREKDDKLATYLDKAQLPHIARYFRCNAHGDFFGAQHEKKVIHEIAMNDKHVERIGDHAAESWLRFRCLDPEGRQKLERDYEVLANRDKGTEAGALEAAVLTILKGVKETATVPDGKGGTTTTAVGAPIVHHHYYGDAKPPEAKAPTAPPTGTAATPAHAPVVVNVHPAPLPSAPPAAEVAKAA